MVRTLRFALLLVLLSLVPAAAAGAHGESHQFESVLDRIDPEVLATGIRVEILDYDSRIRLENQSGQTVVVEGYEGEPYARLDPDGSVFLNARTPALYLNNDRYARTPVDPDTDVDADPDWFRIDRSGRLTWYDHRIHYMGRDIPPAVEDPSERTLIRAYAIPIRVDDRPAKITGSLFWTGNDPFPVLVLAGLLLATSLTALFGAVVIRRLNDRSGTDSDTG